MVDRHAVNKISINLDALQSRIANLEHSIDNRLETALANAAEKLSHLSNKPGPEVNQSTDELDLNAEQRRTMIRELAYLRAEARDFDAGDPVQDWLEAEKEVDRDLMVGMFMTKSSVKPVLEAVTKEKSKGRVDNSLIINPSGHTNTR